MEISPVGFLYICTIVFLLLRRKGLFENLVLLCVVTEMFIEVGYFLQLGDKVLTYDSFIEYVLISYCIVHRKDIKYNLGKKIFILLSCCYLISDFMLLILPSTVMLPPSGIHWDNILTGQESLVYPHFNLGTLSKTLKFILLTFIILYIYSNIYTHKFQYRIFLSRLSNITKVFIIFGCAEFVIKNLLRGNEIWGQTMQFLFGYRDFVVYIGRLRGSSYELNLFTSEASHYAYSLTLMSFIIFSNNIIQEKKRKLELSIFICLALTILSTSFSSVLFVLGFFSIYLTYRWGVLCPKTMKYEKIFLLFLLFFISSFVAILSEMQDNFIAIRLLNMMDRFDDFISSDINYSNNLGDGSTYIRLLSIIQTCLAWTTRPLWGFGLSVTTCHGATIRFLADVGIVGMCMWIKFYFFCNPAKEMLQPQKHLYVIGIVIYLIMNIFNSLGLRPYIGIHVLLISTGYCFVFSKKKSIIT